MSQVATGQPLRGSAIAGAPGPWALPGVPPPPPIGTEDLGFLRELVHERAAVVLEETRSWLVEARLCSLARAEGFPSVKELIGSVRAGSPAALREKVVEAVTPKETSFFRDPPVFQALRQRVLPRLVAARATERRLAIWCAACSSGQEPYSVAMVLAEGFPQLADWDVVLIASDISPAMVERVGDGCYSELEVRRGLSVASLARHFEPAGPHRYRISAELRARVRPLRINLAGDWPELPPMDLVLLRNVLLYFDVATRRTILGRVARLLRPDGLLCLGSAETPVCLEGAFVRAEHGKAAYYRPATGTRSEHAH